MKIPFLLLLFVIISISICLSTLRNHVTIEKFQTTFSNTGCTYPDKITRISGSTLNDCDQAQECKTSFEANHPCIKNNFIDKRCKLIKIWFAQKVKDSYYTFSDDDEHTHIIQMNRDNNLNCRQFGNNDAQLISYLNTIPNSDIKNNMQIFESESMIQSYVDSDPNTTPKLIIGYAYGDNDEETQSKQFDDMNICINFEDKFNDDNGIFNKEHLKNKADEKTFFNPVVDTNAKIVNTGIKTRKRYIKELSKGKYTIVYADSDTSNEVTDDDNTNTVDLNAPKPCSSIVNKPDLWILHRSDNNYHRVEFIDLLTKNTTICKTIKDPNNSGSQIDTNNNSLIKTERELLNNNYVPIDDTKDIFKLNFDFNDTAKWFNKEVDVFGNVHITPYNVKSCGVNEYESSAPETKDEIDLNRNKITMNTSDRTCAPLKQCTAWNIVTPPQSKRVQIYENNDSNEKKEVDMNTTNRKCQPIHLRGKSPNHYFIKNYEAVHVGSNIFSGEFEFEKLTNCQNTTRSKNSIKEYVANQEEFNNSKKTIGFRGPSFHTINRECQLLDTSQCTDDKYVANANHFMFDLGSRYNYNNVHSNLDCQPLTYCESNQYFRSEEFLNSTRLVNGKNVYPKNRSEFCSGQPVCGNNQYIANVKDLSATKKFDMFIKPFECQNLTTCVNDGNVNNEANTYEAAKPETNSDILTNGLFVKDRVCSNLDICIAHIDKEVHLIEPLEQISISGNTETRKVTEFNNAYFVDRTDDTEFDYNNLNYFTCDRLQIKYRLGFDTTTGYNDDIPEFRIKPKFILKKQSKEVVAMMQLNLSDKTIDEDVMLIDLELSDTDASKKNTFKKFPTDIFELYLDSGSCKNMTIKIEDFIFKCKRRQYIHEPATLENGMYVTNNVCKFEHPDIKSCDPDNQFYDVTLSPENEQNNYLYKERDTYCQNYDQNNCKISDKRISCEISGEYTNENINSSYKQLYNDTLAYDTSKECESKCNARRGCGAFKMNSLTNICDFYGFETVKIDIANIDISKFNIKYNTDDTSESEVFISEDDTVLADGIRTKKFTAPVHIVQVTIEPKDSTTRINDLPDDVYIKFYYYDNSYKTYTKSPGSGISNEVDIDSYIRTDALLEIQDIYYIPDDQ